jgi:hypothetical protein
VEGRLADPSAPVVGGNAPPGAEVGHKRTSDLLEELVSQALDGPVDLEWLLASAGTIMRWMA